MDFLQLPWQWRDPSNLDIFPTFDCLADLVWWATCPACPSRQEKKADLVLHSRPCVRDTARNTSVSTAGACSKNPHRSRLSDHHLLPPQFSRLTSTMSCREVALLGTAAAVRTRPNIHRAFDRGSTITWRRHATFLQLFSIQCSILHHRHLLSRARCWTMPRSICLLPSQSWQPFSVLAAEMTRIEQSMQWSTWFWRPRHREWDGSTHDSGKTSWNEKSARPRLCRARWRKVNQVTGVERWSERDRLNRGGRRAWRAVESRGSDFSRRDRGWVSGVT